MDKKMPDSKLRKCSAYGNCPYQTYRKSFMGGEQACAAGSKRAKGCAYRNTKPRK